VLAGVIAVAAVTVIVRLGRKPSRD
jgi:hypothetical protein